jgi:hypothetical protein
MKDLKLPFVNLSYSPNIEKAIKLVHGFEVA